jgi:hypothetical protein
LLGVASDLLAGEQSKIVTHTGVFELMGGE